MVFLLGFVLLNKFISLLKGQLQLMLSYAMWLTPFHGASNGLRGTPLKMILLNRFPPHDLCMGKLRRINQLVDSAEFPHT